MGGAEDRGGPLLPFLPDYSHPDSLLATTEETPAPSRADVNVVTLTGTVRGARTCHPTALGRPARPLGSAVQPSVPPRPPPCPIACRALPALPPAPTHSLSGPGPGPAEVSGGLPRSEGEIAVWTCNSREGNLRVPLAPSVPRRETKDGGRGSVQTRQRSQSR